MTWDNAAIADAVGRVVQVIAPGQTAFRRPDESKPMLVVSYKEDFKFLWSFDDQLRNWLRAGRHVIIVWDGIPDPGRLGQYNVTEYLTPADWAVVATLALDRKPPRITFIDFASSRYQAARSLEAYRGLCNISPSPLAHVAEVHLPHLRDLFRQLIAISRADAEASDYNPLVNRSLLRTIWVALLGEAKGGHHDIANIIGPSLLLESMGHSSGGAPIPLALRKLVGVLRGPNRESRRDPGRWVHLAPINKSADAIVLIDDLAEEGWREFLTAALGLEQEGSKSVRAYLSPYAAAHVDSKYVLDIPAYLEKRLQWLASAGSGDPPSLIPNAKYPLIFLDIRLFSHHSWKEERDFYSSLLGLATRYWNLHALAWPVDLSPITLKPLKKFLESEDSEPESAEHHLALSLLPVLLAIADPTLPIVLFSSTGRRRIIEPLIPCGNIIFDFEKPRVTDHWRDAVETAKFGLQRAVRSAISMLEVRRFLHEVTLAAAATRQEMSRFLARNGKPENKWNYAELYIDETGSGPDYVGGYVVLYDDPATGPASLYRQLREKRLVWGSSREETRKELIERQRRMIRTCPKAGGSPAVSNDALKQRILSTEAVLDQTALYAACVLEVGNRRRSSGVGDFPDLVYRETASALIEIFLYDWLGVVTRMAGPQSTLEAGVFVATRMWKPNSLESLIDCQWNYGCQLRDFEMRQPGEANARVVPLGENRDRETTVGHLPNKKAALPHGENNRVVLARTMEPPDVCRIVNTMFGHRPVPVRVRRALAVTMNDGTKEPSIERPFRPLQIHYASDDFLGCLRRYAKGWREIAALSGPLRRGFYGVADDDLYTLLRASRRMDAADGLAEGLYCLHRVWQRHDLKDVARLIATRAADRVKMISGAEFLQLAYRLSQGQVR